MKQELACMTKAYNLGMIVGKVPHRVTCHICGRRFKPKTFECADKGCWHYAIPPHKKKKWWTVGKARKIRR